MRAAPRTGFRLPARIWHQPVTRVATATLLPAGVAVTLMAAPAPAATIQPAATRIASAPGYHTWHHYAHMIHLGRLRHGYTPSYHAVPVYQARAGGYHIYTSASGGSYQTCVIARESGGDPHAVNSASGAGGLFQFLPSTWAGLGYSGLPQNAPVATQYQAFAKLYAQAGRSPWVSNGC